PDPAVAIGRGVVPAEEASIARGRDAIDGRRGDGHRHRDERRPGGREIREGTEEEGVHGQSPRGVATNRHTAPKDMGATSSTRSPASAIVAAKTSGGGNAAIDRWR